jgi:serine/threonine protein kinase
MKPPGWFLEKALAGFGQKKQFSWSGPLESEFDPTPCARDVPAMTKEQLETTEQLLGLSRDDPGEGNGSKPDELLRRLAEQSFGRDQTLSPEGIQGLIVAARKQLAGFDGSAAEFLGWFESQLVVGGDPGEAGEETLQPGPAADETAVLPLGSSAKDSSDPPTVDPDDDIQDTLVADGSKVPVPTTPVVEPEARDFGDYVLLELIAHGGMGVVYKARQRKLNRIVAIKMIRSGQFADPAEVERFYVEAEAAANLMHDNIVTVYEIGEVEGQHFFSMDYIEGESLSEVVSTGAMLPEAAAGLMQTITRAIEFAHEAGILHRDLKPSNVMLDKQDKPLIMDFGLAKQVNDTSQLTMSGAVVGTPSYMPPEQAAARAEQVDVRSDVYSLGAILYELITGVAPFRAATTYDTLQQVLKIEPVNPRMLNSAVPVDLETICLKCLQKERDRRYPTAKALADELQRFIDGIPIQARPVSRPERFVRWCKRNPRIAALSGTAITGVLVALLAMTVSYFQVLKAKEDVEKSFLEAKSAVDDFFTEVAENKIWKRFPETEAFRRELLEKTRRYYTGFLARQNDLSLGYEQAETNYKIARCFAVLGDDEQAAPLYDQSIRELRQLVGQDPGNKDLLMSLTNCLSGRAEIHDRQRKHEDALIVRQEAKDLRLKLRQISGPPTAEMLRKLANAYMNEGLARNRRLTDQRAERKAQKKSDLAVEEVKSRRTRIYSLFDNASSIRKDALKLTGEQQDNVEMKEDLSRDLAKGAFELYQLFSGEYEEFDENKQTVKFWKQAASYLDQVIVQIQAIRETSLSMEDRHQLVQSVSQQMRWINRFPEAGAGLDEDAVKKAAKKAAQEQLSSMFDLALEHADQLALARDTPGYQVAALFFYMDAADNLYLQGKAEAVVSTFRRLGYAWRSARKEVREELMQQGGPGYYLEVYGQFLQIDAGDQIELKETQRALEYVGYCKQLLDIADQNAWIPDDVMNERRAELETLRQQIGQIGQ